MKKFRDLMIILFIYVFSFVVSYFTINWIAFDNIIINVFLFDILATIIVLIFSYIFNNSSVYDPYWSVLPGLVATYLFFENKMYDFIHILFLCCVLVWSFRLTINWITVTSGFSYEDWRYRMLREKANGNQFVWFILNAFGIHIVPTLFVFLGMLPYFDVFSNELSYLSVIGCIIILIGVGLEIFADIDMHKFLNNTHEKVTCKYGLWKCSRHPNYLGEITVWCGVFVTMITSVQKHWWYIIGCIGMIFMFNVISIPMMEKRQLSRRSDYKDYINDVSRLLILPTRKKEKL